MQIFCHWFVGVVVDLTLEDQCWFYKLEDPVLKCTVYSLSETIHIHWRRDNAKIGSGGKPVGDERTQYNITSYTNNTVRQERLHVSLANFSIEQQSSFRCESRGMFSLDVFMDILGKLLQSIYLFYNVIHIRQVYISRERHYTLTPASLIKPTEIPTNTFSHNWGVV